MEQINFRASPQIKGRLKKIAEEHFGGNTSSALIYMIEKFELKSDSGRPKVFYSDENMGVILENPFWKNDPQFVVNALIRREAVNTEEKAKNKPKMNDAMAKFLQYDEDNPPADVDEQP